MIYNNIIPLYDGSKMSVFQDGTVYEFNELDFEVDDDTEIPQDLLFQFQLKVKEFNSNLCVVFDSELKYYFIAYLGISEFEWVWSCAYEEISVQLTNHLEKNGISFY